MPRTARKKSASEIYHVMIRGNNKQTVFFDDEDREVFLNRIKLTRQVEESQIFAFCLMDNHVHLLVKEFDGNIGQIIKRLLTSYVFWYNAKYERIGNLFQDRFKSEPIACDDSFLHAIRYIHQNPVKAGICRVDEYSWSSYSAYLSKNKSFVDTEMALGMMGSEEIFVEFMKEFERDEFLDYDSNARISDSKLIEIQGRLLDKHKIYDITRMGREAQAEFATILRSVPGTSIRQISRVSGIPISIIRTIKQ